MARLNILIVGGGIGGMASAIRLRDAGHAVELIDIDPHWKVAGAGITVTRPTLRAFRDLGVLDDFLRVGFAGQGIRVCTPSGQRIADIDDPPLNDDSVPGSGGIMRPALHEILAGRVRANGTTIQLGVTLDAYDEGPDAVEVRFSDGGRGRYDLVIGADGVFSKLRTLMFPDAPKPEYTGQYIWRLFGPRPPEIDRRHFFLGGPVKVGVCPVSADNLYLFLLEHRAERTIIPDAALPGEMRRLLAGYGGVLATLRETLHAGSPIVVRPLESFLLPPPWQSRRLVLIGDAAHPTTPQLASGAGLAVEDALVLREELDRATGDVPAALAAFTARRWDRCRMVVENSVEIGRREQANAPPEEQTILVAQSLVKLAEPI